DVNNYVQAWIDPTSDNFVTHAVVGGVDLGWNNVALPGGFDEKEYHTISVTRSGNSFTFSLDGVTQQTRTAAVGNGQVGLVSDDLTANCRHFPVTGDPAAPAIDPDAWYYLFNRRSLRQLSVLGGGTATSPPALIYDPAGATDQLWRIEATGGGYY